jgi:hypothetical protein
MPGPIPPIREEMTTAARDIKKRVLSVKPCKAAIIRNDSRVKPVARAYERSRDFGFIKNLKIL